LLSLTSRPLKNVYSDRHNRILKIQTSLEEKMKKGVLVILLVLVLAAGAMADWSGLAGDQLISYLPSPTDYYGNYYPRVVSGANGHLYAIWAEYRTLRPMEVYFSRSDDNGRTWTGASGDQQISADDGEGIQTAGTDRQIGLALDSQENLYVVWAESLTNQGFEVMLVKSTDQGATWIHSDTDFPISFIGGPRAYLPKIAVDHQDNLHVVWHQNPGNGVAEIMYGFSSDGGATWTSQSADRVISFPDGNFASAPEIAIDGNDNVYVVWPEKTSVEADSVAVHFGKKLACESQFSSETADYQASMGHLSTECVSLAISPDNSLHISYEASNNIGGSFKRAVYYTRSTDGGDTWSGWTNEVYIDLNPMDDSSCTDPQIVATSTGALAVAYCNWDLVNNYTLTRVSYSTDNGVTWSGNTQAEVVSHWDAVDNRPSYTPFICVSAGDTLHVVWKEDCMDVGGGSGYYESMYSRGDVLAGGPAQGIIAGHVYETDGTTPIQDVSVSTYDGGDNLVASNTTNSCGAYSVPLESGTYYEVFAKTDYVTDTLSSIAVVAYSTIDVSINLAHPGGGCQYEVGDANGNGTFNGLDVTYSVAYFKGGPPPPYECECTPGNTWYVAGDVNGSCNFNGLDVTYMVAYFKGGPMPHPCPDCLPTP
jgi:hypothetical protein